MAPASSTAIMKRTSVVPAIYFLPAIAFSSASACIAALAWTISFSFILNRLRCAPVNPNSAKFIGTIPYFSSKGEQFSLNHAFTLASPSPSGGGFCAGLSPTPIAVQSVASFAGYVRYHRR